MDCGLQSLLINARGNGGSLKKPQVGHHSVRAPHKSKGTSFSTRASDRGHPWTTPLPPADRHATAELHEDKREGAVQLETPHICATAC